MDVKCERNARFGFCFRVSSRFHNEVESIPDVSVLQVLKNGIYFTLDGSTFPLQIPALERYIDDETLRPLPDRSPCVVAALALFETLLLYRAHLSNVSTVSTFRGLPVRHRFLPLRIPMEPVETVETVEPMEPMEPMEPRFPRFPQFLRLWPRCCRCR